MESLCQCPLGWLICAGACLSSHSCSQELSLVIRNRGSSLSLPEDFLQGTPGVEYLLCDRQLTQVVSGVFALWGGHCYDSMWKMGTLKLREGKDPLKTKQLARKGCAQTQDCWGPGLLLLQKAMPTSDISPLVLPRLQMYSNFLVTVLKDGAGIHREKTRVTISGLPPLAG